MPLDLAANDYLKLKKNQSNQKDIRDAELQTSITNFKSYLKEDSYFEKVSNHDQSKITEFEVEPKTTKSISSFQDPITVDESCD